MIRSILLSLLSILYSSTCFGIESPVPLCAEPHWASPAESKQGVFHGDLVMECKVTPTKTRVILDDLKAGIIGKIHAESILYEKPSEEALRSSPSLKWDVSHRIQEDGGDVTIREEAEIQTNQKGQLVYQTHSKKVSASGMAGFLKSVNFLMVVDINDPASILINFRNEVKVERPWFAIDFIFAPIAQNICFDKMAKVKTRLLPWVVKLL